MDFFWLIAGSVVGSIVTSILWLLQTGHGILKIDSSNPDKDIYRFEISDKQLDKLPKKKRISLEIQHNVDLRGDTTDYYET